MLSSDSFAATSSICCGVSTSIEYGMTLSMTVKGSGMRQVACSICFDVRSFSPIASINGPYAAGSAPFGNCSDDDVEVERAGLAEDGPELVHFLVVLRDELQHIGIESQARSHDPGDCHDEQRDQHDRPRAAQDELGNAFDETRNHVRAGISRSNVWIRGRRGLTTRRSAA